MRPRKTWKRSPRCVNWTIAEGAHRLSIHERSFRTPQGTENSHSEAACAARMSAVSTLLARKSAQYLQRVYRSRKNGCIQRNALLPLHARRRQSRFTGSHRGRARGASIHVARHANRTGAHDGGDPLAQAPVLLSFTP
eukprot:scaffold202070_cov33-Tisochrysis_lutea.AAC.4